MYFAEKPVLTDYPSLDRSLGLRTRISAILVSRKGSGGKRTATIIGEGAKFYGHVTKEPHHDIGSFKQLDEAKDILKPHKGRAK